MRDKASPPALGRAIAALAARQHGVVAARQLDRLGLERRTVTRRIKAGSLHRLHRGVYAVGHKSVTRRGRYMAAVLACGADAALSYRSAADLWGLRRSEGPIEVTVPHGRAGTQGLRVHVSRMQHPADFGLLHEIRITTVSRTLLDLAAFLPPPDLTRAIDRAERMERFDLTAVDELLSRAAGRRGAATLRRAIASWRPRHTRSELEDRHDELIRAAGLPRPRLNVLVEGELRPYEVDAFWPEHRLVVQLDGFAYHRTRLDHERDAATNADLELAGYRVIRLTWNDVVVNPGRTARRLRRLLTARTDPDP